MGPLSTSGNQIIDGNGVPLTLRGVAIMRMTTDSTLAGADVLSDASYDAMQRWGVNHVRIFLGQHFWLQSCQGVPTYPTDVDAIVEAITGRGMVAMLSLHKLCRIQDNWKMADVRSIDFWREVAERYRSNPLVAFDLYNEPHDISWSQWRNGGTLGDGTKVVGMQTMYDTVRETGAQNLVFVSGNDWATKPPSDTYLLSGYNIVYGTHRYTCTRYPPPQCTVSDPYDPAPPGKRLNRWVSLLEKLPVQITEFGWPAQNSATYNRNVINWAESHGIGWTAFCWSGSNAGCSLIKDTIGYEPTVSGGPVRDGVALNR